MKQIRIADTTPAEDDLVTFLTPDERKEALIRAGKAKQRRVALQLAREDQRKERARQMAIAALHPLERALEAFLASPDLKAGIISSTKAGWGGSRYSVELFPDETWRVLWSNQIGNLYVSPGTILGLPQVNTDDMREHVDAGAGTEDDFMGEAFDIDEDEIKASLRDDLAYRLHAR